MTYDKIQLGDEATYSKVITMDMVKAFADISGDTNPVHIDADYAKGTVFKENIAHGILVTGLISKILGCDLPGYGSVYVSQQVSFLRPVKIGDEITAKVEVIDREDKRGYVTFKTTCANQLGKIVIKGEAIVIPPRN
jgi:3-hydroxybutyryl-CoA dehydratase